MTPVVDTPTEAAILPIVPASNTAQLAVLKKYAARISPQLAEKIYLKSYKAITIEDLTEEETVQVGLFFALLRRMMDFTGLSLTNEHQNQLNPIQSSRGQIANLSEKVGEAGSIASTSKNSGRPSVG